MPARFLIVLCLICVLGTLLMLNYIPIAWIDEVMFADVGRNLAREGKMYSKLWSLPHTEDILLAHLPLWNLVLGLWYKFSPFTLFWYRLPGLLLYALMGLFAWKYFSNKNTAYTAAFMTLLLLGDKCLFEAARSMRMDILGACIFCGLALLRENKFSPSLSALLCGLLILVHPNFWIAALFFFADTVFKQGFQFRFFLLALLPTVLFILWVFPEIDLLPIQLLAHANEHRQSEHQNILNLVFEFFKNRFFVWYEVQQLLPISLLYALVSGILLFAGSKEIRFWIVLLWAQFVFVLFFTGPFPRYILPLVLTVWLMLPTLWKKLPKINRKYKTLHILQSIASSLIILLAMYPMGSRFLVATIQKEARDPKPVLEWMNASVPQDQNFLIFDEAIGFYLDNPHSTFANIHTLNKYNYTEYPGGVYWLCYQPTETSGLVLISKYETYSGMVIPGLPKRITYEGLKLYKVKDENTWFKIYKDKTGI